MDDREGVPSDVVGLGGVEADPELWVYHDPVPWVYFCAVPLVTGLLGCGDIGREKFFGGVSLTLLTSSVSTTFDSLLVCLAFPED